MLLLNAVGSGSPRTKQNSGGQRIGHGYMNNIMSVWLTSQVLVLEVRRSSFMDIPHKKTIICK